MAEKVTQFYKELVQKRDGISGKLDAIEAKAEDGQIREEDRKEYDELNDSLESCVSDLDRAGKRREAELRGQRSTKVTATGTLDTQGVKTVEADHRRVSTIEGLLPGAATADVPQADLEELARNRLTEGDLNAQARAVLEQYPPAESWNRQIAMAHAFGAFLQDVVLAGREGTVTEALEKVQDAILGGGGGEREGTESGWYVPPVFGGTLDRNIVMESPYISRAQQIPMSTNIIRFLVNDDPSLKSGSRFGGVTAGWITEGQEIPETRKPKRKALTMRLKKAGTLGYVTEEMMEDAPAFGAVFQEAMGKELRFIAEDGVILGDGIAEPYGVMNPDTNPALLVIPKAAAQVADTVVWDNFNDMITQLHPMSWDKAVWFYHYLVAPQLNRMALQIAQTSAANADGGVMDTTRFIEWNNTGSHRGITAFGLPGMPSMFSETLGDQGDIALLDMSQYLFASRSMRTGVSMHVEFKTDQQAIKIVWRLEGRPSWLHALEPYKGPADPKKLSPFLVLAARG